MVVYCCCVTLTFQIVVSVSEEYLWLFLQREAV